jgi:hypothetical protein
VSRARTRYIYKNSMELSRKKNTRDFRLTLSNTTNSLIFVVNRLSGFVV